MTPAEFVALSRDAQGLPPTVDDESVLCDLVVLLTVERRAA
jgi:hypothetical protein